MGLDIYIYKTTKKRSNNYSTKWSEVYKSANDAHRQKFQKAYTKFCDTIAQNPSDTTYQKAIKKLFKYTKYPWYDFRKLGIKFTTERIYDNITPVNHQTAKKLTNEIVNNVNLPYVGYFRKVNFLYAFFAPKLVSEMSWINEEDINDIISRCERVLENHDLAEELLPTCSGFFFGGTDYDNWYFEDVEDVLHTFRNLKSTTKENECLFIEMNW